MREEDEQRGLYAIRFEKDDLYKGARALLTRTDALVLRGEIFVIGETDLALIRSMGLNFQQYLPRTNDADEVYRHFGIPTVSEWLAAREQKT